MVLARIAVVLIWLAGLGACKESLFDNSGGSNNGSADASTTGDAPTVPTTCPAPCLGDAAGDYDGMSTSAKWRYVEDTRNRAWTPMAMSGNALVGTLAAENRITTCAAEPNAAACAALPGALLVSSAGAMTAADPAIGYVASQKQVIQLNVLAHVPAEGTQQQVRLYRNSREDVLFTGTAEPGATLGHTHTVDALAGDRFYVALAPTAFGTTDVGVHLFVSDTGMVFPSRCLMAVPFDMAAGNTVIDECGGHTFTYINFNVNPSQPSAPVLGPTAFPELGMAADIPREFFYEGSAALNKPGDVTVQLWMRHDTILTASFPFSDIDLNNGGGIGLDVYETSSLNLEMITCRDETINPCGYEYASAGYPAGGGWHFVRFIYTNGMGHMCLDGIRVASTPITEPLTSSFAPRLGRNAVWAYPYYDGGLDDVRVFNYALPCE